MQKKEIVNSKPSSSLNGSNIQDITLSDLPPCSILGEEVKQDENCSCSMSKKSKINRHCRRK